MNSYSSLCDNCGIFTDLNTKLDLPTTSETVLQFFESIQKSFPSMTEFEKRESGEIVLQEEREEGCFRSVALEPRRLAAACMNSETVAEVDLFLVDRFHSRILEIAPYHLGLSALNCDSLDVVFTFDFLYTGNHDEVIAEALGLGTPCEGLLQIPGSRVTHFEPALMISLDEACRLQARMWIESRTTSYQVRTGQYVEAPLTVYFLIHQDWSKAPFKTFVESYRNQRKLAQELIDTHVVPSILLPLQQTISTK